MGDDKLWKWEDVTRVRDFEKISIYKKVIKKNKIGKLVLEPKVEGLGGQWNWRCHVVDAQ